MNERRHEPRVKTLNLVDVGEFTDAGLMTNLTIGRTLDLSHDGMRLELNHLIPKGSTVTLDLEFGETIIEFHGKVVSSAPTREADRFVMGVEFLDLTGEALEKLHEYLGLRGD
jgi:PilZ domain